MVAKKVQKTKKDEMFLTDECYLQVINKANMALNLSVKELRLLKECVVPRFIAEIPFLAKQENPEVISAFNLISYITGSRNKKFFAQRANQTISERIDTYIHGSDGDREVVSFCKDVLEEVSLYDHKSDLPLDAEKGYPNPLLSGEIDFHTERKRLKARKYSYSHRVRKLIEGRYEGEILASFWTYP